MGVRLIFDSDRDAVMTARQYDSPVERPNGFSDGLYRPSYNDFLRDADSPPRVLSAKRWFMGVHGQQMRSLASNGNRR